MTQEEKSLLLKDLCARLPYGVRVKSSRRRKPVTLSLDVITDFHLGCSIKPYLRPMSSMTKEEKEEYEMLQTYSGFKTNHTDLTDMYDWLNAHHFDYRGLIEKGLALVAPKGMYNYSNNYN